MERYVLPIRELPEKSVEKTSQINIKTIKRVAFKMPILRLKGDYGHFKLLKYTEGAL